MCGCLNKTMSTQSRSAARKITTSSSKVVKKSSEPVCYHKYEEVLKLGKKIVLLIRKHRDPMLNEANKKLLSWLRNLDVTCPDEYEYKVLTQFIDEYTDHKT